MKSKFLNNKIMKAFDAWSQTYESTVEEKIENRGYSYKSLAEIVTEKLGTMHQDVILELGTGTGVLGKEFKPLTHTQLVGLDISKAMLLEANKRQIYEVLYQCSAEDIPLPDQCVDGVYSTFMLHSVMNQPLALSEIYRVLKPNKHCLIVDLCPRPTSIPLLNLVSGIIHSFKYEFGAFSKYRTTEEYRRLMEISGFEVIQIEKLGIEKDYTHYIFLLKRRTHEKESSVDTEM